MINSETDDFQGQVLFATGAGSGIAAETARQFTAGGGRVAVVDLSLERARASADALEGAIALAADVSDEAAVAVAIAATRDQLGRIDCVLNAAGYADFDPIEKYSWERWQRMMTVHAGGTFLVCKHAVPALRERGGAIVNIASTAALEAQPNNFAYGAAKGAIVSFSRQLALDLAPDNIRVNAVAPGRTRTALTEPLYAGRADGTWEGGAKLASAGIMQRRVADAHEIANLIIFLLSGKASFMTAGTYVADGGETSC